MKGSRFVLAALAALAVLSLAALALASCGSSVSKEPVRITFGTHRTDQINRGIRSLLEEFEKRNPGIKVDAVPIPELV